MKRKEKNEEEEEKAPRLCRRTGVGVAALGQIIRGFWMDGLDMGRVRDAVASGIISQVEWKRRAG